MASYTRTETTKTLFGCATHGLRLFVTPGNEENPYWAAYPNFRDDYQVATVSDFESAIEQEQGYQVSLDNADEINGLDELGVTSATITYEVK